MTRVGVTVDDIGEPFSWFALRDFINHLPPVPECAYFRATHPKSWWWTPQMDFSAAALLTAQWANWQRGGGKGSKPQAVKRPKENPRRAPKSADDLKARQAAVRNRRRRR